VLGADTELMLRLPLLLLPLPALVIGALLALGVL
jgi:hypothetical protein